MTERLLREESGRTVLEETAETAGHANVMKPFSSRCTLVLVLEAMFVGADELRGGGGRLGGRAFETVLCRGGRGSLSSIDMSPRSG